MTHTHSHGTFPGQLLARAACSSECEQWECSEHELDPFSPYQVMSQKKEQNVEPTLKCHLLLLVIDALMNITKAYNCDMTVTDCIPSFLRIQGNSSLSLGWHGILGT